MSNAIGNAVIFTALGALTTGVTCWTLNMTGLAKNVMGVAAPHFKHGLSYGALRGLSSYVICYLTVEILKKQRNGLIPLVAVIIAFVGLYKCAFWSADFARSYGAKINDRYVYLSLLIDVAAFYQNQ